MLLGIVKDFDGEVIYYSGKANAIIDALSLKLAREQLQELCLRITVFTPLFELL